MKTKMNHPLIQTFWKSARVLLLAIPLVLLSLQPFSAQAEGPDQPGYTQTAKPDEADLTSHRSYVNKNGQVIHSPAKTKSGKAPTGASAKCRDGSYSFSHSRRGTCSHHGGVATWL